MNDYRTFLTEKPDLNIFDFGHKGQLPDFFDHTTKGHFRQDIHVARLITAHDLGQVLNLLEHFRFSLKIEALIGSGCLHDDPP
jgi:hypothetical protein